MNVSTMELNPQLSFSRGPTDPFSLALVFY
jgi:hypothetical protein